jgi:serine protease inhibitor
MGITSLFDPKTCDLSGLISSVGQTTISVSLSQMIHQTLLDVNELGATGAAGTILAGYPISSSSAFDVDKPFLFLLNDRLTGPVLIGQMIDPNN